MGIPPRKKTGQVIQRLTWKWRVLPFLLYYQLLVPCVVWMGQSWHVGTARTKVVTTDYSKWHSGQYPCIAAHHRKGDGTWCAPEAEKK